MAKRRDWSKVGEVVEKIRKLGLSYAEGARRFGIKPWLLYAYTRQEKLGPGQGLAAGGAGAATGQEKKTSKRGVQLPEEVQERIRSYRRENPTHGFKRIVDLLKEKYRELSVGVQRPRQRAWTAAGLRHPLRRGPRGGERPGGRGKAWRSFSAGRGGAGRPAGRRGGRPVAPRCPRGTYGAAGRPSAVGGCAGARSHCTG